MRSWRSISPTDCCDETRKLRMARRFGSATISNMDSTLCIYLTVNIRVKEYKRKDPLVLYSSPLIDDRFRRPDNPPEPATRKISVDTALYRFIMILVR